MTIKTQASGQRVGYVRVSSLHQNTARQLHGESLDRVFEDRVSGKEMQRPALQQMLAHVRQGDTIVVHSLDRLGRNMIDLQRIIADLTSRGVTIEFLKEHLTFTGDDNAMSRLLLGIMGSLSQFERELIRERQAEGITLAKQAGKYKGRKALLAPETVAEIRKRVATGEPKAALAEEYGVSRMTLYNALATPAKTA